MAELIELPRRNGVSHPNPIDVRKAEYPIDPLFLRRWSPRAMSGASISERDLMSLFEAARWAPSAFNQQPWRMLYARRDTPAWPTFLGLLVDANQVWCKDAAALVVFISRTTFTRNNKPNAVYMFDCGSAWENFALQGAKMGLVVHGMAGFDNDRARDELGVPTEYAVCAMAAVGHPGDPSMLPENLRGLEIPSDRQPVREITMEGRFRA